MTCIIGLVENSKVYIGGDSAGVAGYGLSVRADEKVFKKGDFIFGFWGFDSDQGLCRGDCLGEFGEFGGFRGNKKERLEDFVVVFRHIVGGFTGFFSA